MDWLSWHSHCEQLSANPYRFSSNDTRCRCGPHLLKNQNRIHMPAKSGQDSSRELASEECMVTFDEGICCEAKRIQSAISPELDNVIVRLEGFIELKTSSVLLASA